LRVFAARLERSLGSFPPPDWNVHFARFRRSTGTFARERFRRPTGTFILVVFAARPERLPKRVPLASPLLIIKGKIAPPLLAPPALQSLETTPKTAALAEKPPRREPG
jgi:hypothetical protein